jgi:hypothetical protein
MNHPVPGGDHHSNPSIGSNIGQCFLNARLVGRELMPAKIAQQKTRICLCAIGLPSESSCICKKYMVFFLADSGDYT